MSRYLRVFAAALLTLAGGAAFAANWHLVASYHGERVEIDRARVARIGEGQTIAWNRLDLGRELKLPGSKESYTAVEALNRYDCAKNTFTTMKRVFFHHSKIVSAEVVRHRKEVPALPGSIDEKLLVEACKKRTVGEMRMIAAEAAKAAAKFARPAKKRAKPHAMYADMLSAAPAKRAERPKSATRRRHDERASRHGTRTPPVAAQNIPWSYHGAGGPAHWGKLRPDYVACEAGKFQSPINISDGIRVDQKPIKFDYKRTKFRIIDTGHTVEIDVGAGSSISVMGRTYALQKIVFHRPSEERVDAHVYPMEMQLVHQDSEGHIAVVAVLLKKGALNPIIQTFWNDLPLQVGQDLAPDDVIDLAQLLPKDRGYYAFMGSLTTPPCTEGVLWLVLKQPMTVSPYQVAIFSRLYPNNARPIQPTNDRLIKESR